MGPLTYLTDGQRVPPPHPADRMTGTYENITFLLRKTGALGKFTGSHPCHSPCPPLLFIISITVRVQSTTGGYVFLCPSHGVSHLEECRSVFLRPSFDFCRRIRCLSGNGGSGVPQSLVPGPFWGKGRGVPEVRIRGTPWTE